MRNTLFVLQLLLLSLLAEKMVSPIEELMQLVCCRIDNETAVCTLLTV